jgi:hypothetical protein
MRKLLAFFFVIGFIAWAVSRGEQNSAANSPALEMHTVQTAAGPQRLMTYADPSQAPTPLPPRTLSPKEAARPNFTLEKFSWRKEAFDTVMVADFTFNNKNAFDIKDVELRCEHSAESGTKIDTNERTIYQIFRSYSVRTVSGFNMGFVHSQARRSSCDIVDFVVMPGTERPKPAATKTMN